MINKFAIYFPVVLLFLLFPACSENDKRIFREEYLHFCEKRYNDTLTLAAADAPCIPGRKKEVEYFRKNIDADIIPTILLSAWITPTKEDGKYELFLFLFEEKTSFAKGMKINFNGKEYIYDIKPELLKLKRCDPHFWKAVFPETYNTPVECFETYPIMDASQNTPENGTNKMPNTLYLSSFNKFISNTDTQLTIKLLLENNTETDAVVVSFREADKKKKSEQWDFSVPIFTTIDGQLFDVTEVFSDLYQTHESEESEEEKTQPTDDK